MVEAPWELLPLRLAIGCCLAGILPSAYALVGHATLPARRGGGFGLILSASHLGNFLGPLCGGAISAVFGLRTVFVITAASLFFSAWLVQRIKPLGDVDPIPRCAERA
jgi:DHA1 family multidrug resistance protein-like MFS transporter